VRPVLDVSGLQTVAFGNRAISWWGLFGIIAIEGTMFALAIAAYLYLAGRAPHWPPNVLPPALLFGTLNTVVLLASVWPNQIVKRAAEHKDVFKVQRWLLVSCAFGILFCIVRVYEFRALNVWWDDNAYGSVVWTLLGLHTAHLVTDLMDTIVLTVLMFTGPIEEKHLVDTTENSIYWDFVVLAWLPIYALIYFYPRVS
jgi:cytochrome c oxidase subunit 3